jgi:hypothetical protein
MSDSTTLACDFLATLNELRDKGYRLSSLSENRADPSHAPRSPDQEKHRFHCAINSTNPQGPSSFYWGNGDTPEEAARAAMRWIGSGKPNPIAAARSIPRQLSPSLAAGSFSLESLGLLQKK